MTVLPESLCNLTQLILLNLCHNELTVFPDSLCNLLHLQSLDLSYNQLTTLPKLLGNLIDLRSLNLAFNQLTTLPISLGNLSQLDWLNLYNNQLTVLPESLSHLTQLRELSIISNQLNTLPESLGNLTKLQTIAISYNQLTTLPESLGNLFNLRSLNLSNNQLIKLPESLGNLTQLQEFYLFRNQLEALPESLSKLSQFSRLDFSFNQLTTLPKSVGNLSRLRSLDLTNNQLKTLPESLGKLTNLQRLDLNNNPLNPELAAAYAQGLDAVKAYLRAQFQSQIILNEAKLILIGEGEVGKTSLLGALRGDPWRENRPTTHGVEITIQTLTLPHDSTDITLNGWDFGGQAIYRHTHQLFFTAPALYLAVWNPRRGPEQCRVEEWIKMVKHRAYDETRPDDKPRILVIATHGGPKERLDHIDEQSLREEFGDLIIDFHHVDSKTEYGLPELKQIIAQTAAAIPQVGRTVPASYKQVLDALHQRSQTDAWISYEQYQTLCTQHNVELPLAKTYAAILNELGHLIHYSSDPILKDTVILKPEWLSKAISFVLEDQQVKDQNGLVTHDRLRELWDDPDRGTDRYPIHLHEVFRKLMERCDLSYQVEFPNADAPPTSLMAQLVPSSRPENWQADWILKPGDTERTQICRILDAETGRTAEVEGLMYRLIVRLHRYSLGRNNYYQSRHWKNGLLLDDGFNGRAFLEEIAGDVYITVRAAYPTGFLGHLCAEVEWLVNHFWKGLDPRLYLPCPAEHCQGLLERKQIIAYKNRGSQEIYCTVCCQFHNIDDLMAAPAAKPEWQDAVSQLNRGQAKILQIVDRGFDSLSVQLRTLMSQADEQYRALLTTLTDPAKDGPRLFSIEPIDPGFWDKPKWITQYYRVTLWCEHSRLPLPAINGKDDPRGVYEIELTRDWLKRAAPILRIISVTLKLALPIAIPGTKLATDDAAYKAIEEQLEFGVQSANALLEGREKINDWLVDGDTTDLDPIGENTRSAIRAQGSVLRELHALLQAKDPTHSFGGLEKVQNKRCEFLWVHSRYVDQY